MSISPPTNIALLYFSRTANAEGRNKRWFGTKTNRNRGLAASLIQQSSGVVGRLGLPVFHFNEYNQRGKSFGERLANAYAEVFERGYDAVIAVGNDCPELGCINWQYYIQQLALGYCVIGPSARGGAYFIGITRLAFRKEIFKQLPWQTKGLFDALRLFCSEQPLLLIEQLRDVNSLRDLGLLLKNKELHLALRLLLARLLYILLFVFFVEYKVLYNNILAAARPLRAPPICKANPH